MKTQSRDTNPEVEKKLIEMLRKKSSTDNLKSALSLSSLTMQMSKRAIERANPDKSSLECDLIFVELHYGKALALKLEKYLDKKKNDSK